jgi:putative transposase
MQTVRHYERKRRSIHTHAKFLVYVNALPASHLQQLSPSQISKYKNHFKPTDHFGSDLWHLFGEQVDTLKLLNECAALKKQIIALLKIIALVKTFFISQKQALQLLHNTFFVTFIQQFKNCFPAKRIARFLQLSPQSIAAATKKQTYACTKSVMGLCSQKYFQQPTAKEIENIKNYCFDKAHTYWPLCSIYFKGLREGIFHFSLRTFYKYCKAMGIKKYSKKNYRPKNGLISTHINQYWNADVTIYRTADGVLHYIYLVMDHFSKKILSWSISPKKCGKIRVQTFRVAVLNYLKSAQIELPKHIVQLIVDAGSENNNGDVDGFLGKLKFFLRKVIALKDIVHSNSPIEAVNKIVKNNYLNKITVENGSALEKVMQHIVSDYNNRPHGSLNGITPNEKYNMQAVVIPKNFEQQREKRNQHNKNFCCKNTT